MTSHHVHDSLLFEDLEKEKVDQFLSEFSEVVLLKKGAWLWKQGEPGNTMYLIESGKLEVMAETDILLTTLEKGAVIGEICVFGQQSRSAGVRAAEDSKLLLIEGDLFRKRVHARDVTALLMSYNIAKILSQRMVSVGDLIRKMQKKMEKEIAKEAEVSEMQRYRRRFFEDSLFN